MPVLATERDASPTSLIGILINRVLKIFVLSCNLFANLSRLLRGHRGLTTKHYWGKANFINVCIHLQAILTPVLILSYTRKPVASPRNTISIESFQYSGHESVNHYDNYFSCVLFFLIGLYPKSCVLLQNIDYRAR
jgi:hypothetical protein